MTVFARRQVVVMHPTVEHASSAHTVTYGPAVEIDPTEEIRCITSREFWKDDEWEEARREYLLLPRRRLSLVPPIPGWQEARA